MLRASFRETMTFDWNGLAVGHAVRRLITLLFFLALSAWFNDVELGLFPIVGAVVVGFGSIRALGASLATPMFLASLGIAVASFLGSLIGASPSWSALGVAFAALTFGQLSAAGPGTAWAAQNCLVFFLVLGLPFPASPPVALHHALLVLAGGLCQSVTLTVFYYARRFLGLAHPSAWFLSAPAFRTASERAFRSLFHGPKFGGESFLYGLRLMAALEMGQLLGQSLHFQRSAWILMTTALVLKADLPQTLSRGIGRCGGTMVGGLFTTALVTALQPSHLALSALLVLSAGMAYLTFYVNYALCTVFITSYVVFLLAFAGLPGPEVAVLRVCATLIGGGLAVFVFLPWRSSTRISR